MEIKRSAEQPDGMPRSRQLPGIPGCEILVGSFRAREFPRHSHEGLMLSAIEGGVQRVTGTNMDLWAGLGQVIAVSPFEVHQSKPGAPGWWQYSSVMIPLTVIPEIAHGSGTDLRTNSAIDDAELAIAIRAAAYAMLDAEVLTAQFQLASALRLFLERHGRIVLKSEGRGRESRAIALAQDYLRARLDRAVCLSELAGVAGIDGWRLTRAFTSLVGIPPHAWHVQTRVREGQTRLSLGQAVAEVAAATGFADQPHFTRAFRRLVGVTPAAFKAGRPSR